MNLFKLCRGEKKWKLSVVKSDKINCFAMLSVLKNIRENWSGIIYWDITNVFSSKQVAKLLL